MKRTDRFSKRDWRIILGLLTTIGIITFLTNLLSSYSMEEQVQRIKQELHKIDQVLEELMLCGCNDETLVDQKRKLQQLIRDYEIQS